MKNHLSLFLPFLLLLTSCTSSSSLNSNSSDDITCDNYRAAMRDFVIEISNTARQTKSSFIVIPQNGQNVAWDDDSVDTIIPDKDFFDAIDGTGREDVFYGMNSQFEIADGFQTPAKLSHDIQDMCDIYLSAGKTVLSIDYTSSNQSKIIVEAIKSLYSNPEKILTLGENAYSKTEKEYSWENSASKLIEFLEK